MKLKVIFQVELTQDGCINVKGLKRFSFCLVLHRVGSYFRLFMLIVNDACHYEYISLFKEFVLFWLCREFGICLYCYGAWLGN